MTPDRVIVYFDWQNCFNSALEAFPSGSTGNVHPLKVATRLVKKPPAGVTTERSLTKVKLYRGLASPRKAPGTNAAAQKQHAAWRAGYEHLVEVNARPLAYRREHFIDSHGSEVEHEVAREKGVDVQLAIDLVRDTTFSDPPSCTTAVLFSEDTDFHPALELIVQKHGRDAVEVARWCSDRRYPPDPPRIAGVKLRQHLLDYTFYRSVEDATAYRY